MASSFRYLVFALGIVAACVSFGRAEPTVPDVAAAPKPEAKPPEFPEIKEAVDLFQQRKFDEALKLLDKAVKKGPDLPPAQVIMYQLFLAAQQPAAARLSLERAVMLEPADPEAFVILGNIAMQDRRVTDSELLYAKAKDLLPGFKSSQKRKDILEKQTTSGLANVAEAREQWALAQSYLETLLKLDPKDAFAMQRLARALFQQTDAPAALKKLREAKAADPKSVLTPEAALGGFYEQYGDHKNATVWMDKALAAAPDDLRTVLVYAGWALETGGIDAAEARAEKAVALDPQSLEAKIIRGAVALFKKDYKTAVKWFEDAHLQSPSSLPASNNLALALCEVPDSANSKNPDVPSLKRALEYAQANYQANSRNAECLSTLGWVFYKARDLDRADMALRQAASAGNLSPDTAYYLAQISYDRGRAADAKALLEAVLKTTRPFSMRPEADTLLKKINSEPAPSKPAAR